MKKVYLLFCTLLFSGTVIGGLYLFYPKPLHLEISNDEHKPVILKPSNNYLHFWASWCGPCLMELPALVAYAGRHPEISIYPLCASNESPADIQKIYDKLNLKHLKIYYDKDAKLQNHYQIQGFPQTLIVDSNFKVLKKMSGAQQWQYYT